MVMRKSENIIQASVEYLMEREVILLLESRTGIIIRLNDLVIKGMGSRSPDCREPDDIGKKAIARNIIRI